MFSVLGLASLSLSATPAPAVSEVVSNPPTLMAALGSVVTVALTGALIWLGRALKGRLQRVLDQTENSHEKADYPNLRDELTATRTAAEQAVEAVADLAKIVREDRAASREETEGVRQDVRLLAQRVDLHLAKP